MNRELVSEGLGTALLLCAVVGSGIMGDRLAGGNVAIALLANMIATGATLAALILTFGPISGAHFNPAVTLSNAGYIAAQISGALAGVAAAHHRCLLVHGFHFFRQSRRDAGAVD